MSWAWLISETSTVPADGERMVRPGDQDELVLVQRTAADAGVAELPDDPEFDLAASHEVDDLLRMAGPHEQANIRVSLGEADQDLRQDVGADGGRDRERELTDDAVFELADERPTATDRLDRAVGMRQEGATGGCQDHARVRPPEERRAELLLEGLEPGGERRLADRQGVRRASHVPLPGDLDEPFDLGEEHAHDLRLGDRYNTDHT